MKTLEVLYNDMDKQRLINKLAKLTITKAVRAEFSYFKSNRSAAQNRYLWLIIQEIIDHFVETTGQYKTKEQVYAWLMDLFAPVETFEINGQIVNAVKTTSKMTTDEMSQLINKIDICCSTNLDLVLTKPTDLYAEAMGFKKTAEKK